VRRHIATGALLTLLVLPACSGLTEIDWTDPGRESWQRPGDVVEALGLTPGARVADLGAGEGYFVPYLAAAVEETGRVYAVEVDAELGEALQARFADAPNVEVVLGAYDDPGLPDGAIDLVLLVNTYHHIEDRPAYFRRLAGDLAPGGRVAILEPDGELGGILSLTLDEGHTSVASEVTSEMSEAGYRHAASHDFLPVQIFEVYAPGGVAAAR
jgi:SAM-dependent methyltransferase